MKFCNYYILFFASILLLGCNNDEETQAPELQAIDSAKFPNTWKLTDIKTVGGKATATLSGVPLTGEFTTSGKDYTAEISFTEGTGQNANTFTSQGGFTAIFSIDLTLQKFDTEQNFPNFFGAGTWKLDGNDLVTTVLGKDSTLVIQELTDTEMKINIPLKESITYAPLNLTAELTGTFVATFSKK